MFKKEEIKPDLEVFTLFDTKVGTYRLPSYAINRHDIMRQIENLMKDQAQEKSEIVSNAEDFQLFKIGGYHKGTGTIFAHAPEHIANLHEIKASLKSRALETT